MDILIADDDKATRMILGSMLQQLGHTPAHAEDGQQALNLLENSNFRILILDWNMPVLNGLGVCERIRSRDSGRYIYIIFVSIRDQSQDIVQALDAGADDYISKPYDHAELSARIRAAVRIITLQQDLRTKIDELEKALKEVRVLRGLIPICAYCKRVRTDKGYWEQVESYISDHTDAEFTHGICPDCLKEQEKLLEEGTAVI